MKGRVVAKVLHMMQDDEGAFITPVALNGQDSDRRAVMCSAQHRSYRSLLPSFYQERDWSILPLPPDRFALAAPSRRLSDSDSKHHVLRYASIAVSQFGNYLVSTYHTSRESPRPQSSIREGHQPRQGSAGPASSFPPKMTQSSASTGSTNSSAERLGSIDGA